jgi:hypothetical protein
VGFISRTAALQLYVHIVLVSPPGLFHQLIFIEQIITLNQTISTRKLLSAVDPAVLACGLTLLLIRRIAFATVLRCHNLLIPDRDQNFSVMNYTLWVCVSRVVAAAFNIGAVRDESSL